MPESQGEEKEIGFQNNAFEQQSLKYNGADSLILHMSKRCLKKLVRRLIKY